MWYMHGLKSLFHIILIMCDFYSIILKIEDTAKKTERDQRKKSKNYFLMPCFVFPTILNLTYASLIIWHYFYVRYFLFSLRNKQLWGFIYLTSTLLTIVFTCYFQIICLLIDNSIVSLRQLIIFKTDPNIPFKRSHIKIVLKLCIQS